MAEGAGVAEPVHGKSGRAFEGGEEVAVGVVHAGLGRVTENV
jgi:hypothetical protein